jgi:nucleoside-diphosphate-sugar epimerase
MKILITGNQGYLGPAVIRQLRQSFPEAHLAGYDSGFFALATTNAAVLPERLLNEQYFGDIREIPVELLKGADAVVHLAAISNDPMGNKFERVTEDINQKASLELARKAVDAGVRRFVFASSCSVYGFAPGAPRRESDELNPQTAYARSKVATEAGLSAMARGDMVVSSLRFATACGMSDRLRLDLVLNDFVAAATATRKITVLSDGTPWRPLIDIRDMARAIVWALLRDPASGGPCLSVNVGSLARNYQVKDLADAVAAAIPQTEVSINKQAQPDNRSYQVDFSLFARLAPDHQPQVTLAQSIDMLYRGLSAMGFNDPEFRSSPLVRLKTLEAHIAAGRLTGDLRWTKQLVESA